MKESRFYDGKTCVKVLRMFNDKDKIIVQELELREQGEKKNFVPTFMETFDTNERARVVWIGRLTMIGYENGNPTEVPFGNIFRNSLNRGV
jgi:hypothetical protein